VELGGGTRVRLTDTVGFIRKLPHHLVASFRATLEEARAADLLLHIVDASHPEAEDQILVVDQVLAELEMEDTPVRLVFNKMDLVPQPTEFARGVCELHPDALLVTTMRTDGLEPLKGLLREEAERLRPPVRVLVPLSDGATLARLYRQGEVLRCDQVDGDYAVTVRLEPWQVSQWREAGGRIQ
jgi:GTP-binding protein HflX